MHRNNIVIYIDIIAKSRQLQRSCNNNGYYRSSTEYLILHTIYLALGSILNGGVLVPTSGARLPSSSGAVAR